MADVLMGTNQDQYNRNIQEKSKYMNEFNQILAAYVAMGIGTPTGAEFKALVQNPAGFVFDKLTNGQDVVIGGLKVNKTKAMEILEKPAGYQAMADLIADHRNKKANFIHYLNAVDVVSGQVVIAQSILDAELAAAKIWAKTDDEKAAYQMALDIKAMWETVFAGKYMPSPGNLIGRIVKVEANPFNSSRKEDQVLRVNVEAIPGILLAQNV